MVLFSFLFKSYHYKHFMLLVIINIYLKYCKAVQLDEELDLKNSQTYFNSVFFFKFF